MAVNRYPDTATSPWHGGVLGLRTASSHYQILTTTKNQGRGVKDHPEGGPTPFKLSRETLSATELTIAPPGMLELSSGGQTIFCHRNNN